MKKLYYLFFLTAIFFSSCSSNTPELPPVSDDEITVESILGTWEVYYSEKQITSDPYTNPVKFPGFRNPEFDGFKTIFYKENGTYKFKSLNVVGGITDLGTYSIVQDAANPKAPYIKLHITERGGKEIKAEDISWRATSLSSKDGILTIYFGYEQTNKKNDVFYVTDSRGLRNIAIAPNAHPKVNKVDLNYSNLKGTWEIYDYKAFSNGTLQTELSKTELDSIRGNTFEFGYSNENKMVCTIKIKHYDKTNETWSYDIFSSAPVILVDDVVHLFPKVINEEGNLEDYPIFLWIKDWAKRTDSSNNVVYEATFVDFEEFRDAYSPKDLYKIERYLKKTN